MTGSPGTVRGTLGVGARAAAGGGSSDASSIVSSIDRGRDAGGGGGAPFPFGEEGEEGVSAASFAWNSSGGSHFAVAAIGARGDATGGNDGSGVTA